MLSSCDVSSATIFQAARNRIEQDIGDIIQCLNNKKVELFEDINRLEKEFADKQQQTQKELKKLKILKSQTEKLSENNLLKVQEKVVTELQQEIDRLKLEDNQEPDYKISVKWGFTKRVVIKSINSSAVDIITDTGLPGAMLLEDGASSSDDLNTELAMLPYSGSDSEGEQDSVPFRAYGTRPARREQDRITPPLVTERQRTERRCGGPLHLHERRPGGNTFRPRQRSFRGACQPWEHPERRFGDMQPHFQAYRDESAVERPHGRGYRYPRRPRGRGNREHSGRQRYERGRSRKNSRDSDSV